MHKLEKLLDKVFGEPPLTKEAKQFYAKNDAEVAKVSLSTDAIVELV